MIDLDRLRREHFDATQEVRRAERFGGHAFVPWEKFSANLQAAKDRERRLRIQLEEAEAENP